MEYVISFLKSPLRIRSLFAAEHDVSGQIGVSAANTIPINSRSVAIFLSSVAAIILLASLAVALAGYFAGYDSKLINKLAKIFSVDKELNVPAFFSMLILVIASALLATTAYLKLVQRAVYRWHWVVLALGFLYMAFDEIAEVHEKLIDPMRAALGGEALGIFYFAWVVPALVLVSALAFFFLRFWWSLPIRTRVLFFIAGFLYLGGAIGVELLDGKYAEIYDRKNLTYMLLSNIEESLEIAGVIVFIYALLDYLASYYKKIELRFKSTTAS